MYRVPFFSSSMYFLLLTFTFHYLPFNTIIVYYNILFFGCCDEEISLFVGPVKEILILILIT